MTTSGPLELCRDQYVALRAEICQSIRYQHQILLSGYGAMGAVFGYLATQKMWLGIAALPFIALAMAALWLVEANRMVRASYYIATELWPQMKTLTESTFTPCWEYWIRHSPDDADKFRVVQNGMQRLVVISVPVLISLSSALVAITYALTMDSPKPNPIYATWVSPAILNNAYPLVGICAAISSSLLWIPVYVRFRLVSDPCVGFLPVMSARTSL